VGHVREAPHLHTSQVIHRDKCITSPHPKGCSGPCCRRDPVGVLLEHPGLWPLAMACAPRTGHRPPVVRGKTRKARCAVAKAAGRGPATGDAVVLPTDLREVWHAQARRKAFALRTIRAPVRLAWEGKDVLLRRRTMPLPVQRVAQERAAWIDRGETGLFRREGPRQVLVQKGRHLGLDLCPLCLGPMP
jgi:hypothetical protein